MKYLKHELNTRNNDKIYELIEAHGMQGYGLWWLILEELYKAEENDFQISATETWFKRISRSNNLTDWRTLIRTLDTMASLNLIDPQMWADHIIFCHGIVERADAYMTQKENARQRKRAQRERDKQARDAVSRVTDAGQNASHTSDTTNLDPIQFNSTQEEEIESTDNANEPPEHTEMAVLSARMQDTQRPVKLSEVKWQKTYKDNKPRQWQSCPISLGVARTREGMQAAVKAVGSEDEALKLFGEALQWIAVNGDEFWKRSTHGFNSLLKPDTLHFLQFGATAREQQKQQQPVHSAAAQEDSRAALNWLYEGYGTSIEDVAR
jgi:hypothetical protein